MRVAIKKLLLSACLVLALPAGPLAATEFQPGRGLNMDIWMTWPAEARWAEAEVLLPWPEWRKTVDPARLADLKAAGFDTIRIPFDPAVFLSRVSAPLHDRLYDELLATVREVNAAGLKAIVDLHLFPRGDTGLGMEAVLGDRSRYDDYLDIIRRTGRTIAREDPAMVAFELMNEPDTPCDAAGASAWSDVQRELFAAARASATRLTIILTGGCGGSAEGLVALDPARIPDDNVLWSFHSYRPFILTHQGAEWAGDFIRYVTGLTYPLHAMPAAERETALAAIRERIRDEAPWSRRAGMISYLDEQLGEIDTAEELSAVLREPFRMVADWTRKHGIDASRVILGEFGMIRQEWENPSIVPAASRAAYVRDMARLAEEYGFAWAVWGYGGAFGVVESFGGEAAEPDVLDVVRDLPPAGLRH